MGETMMARIGIRIVVFLASYAAWPLLWWALTDAVILLAQARERVADHVEGKP